MSIFTTVRRHTYGSLTGALLMIGCPAFAQGSFTSQSASPNLQFSKEAVTMSNEKSSVTGAAEMKAAAALTTKVLAIGSWTAKSSPEKRPAIMPSEARDTLRLQLAGKIDQWFAKTDGSGAVFLMNVTDTAEAHALLEALPLGQAGMMTGGVTPGAKKVRVPPA